MYKNNNNGYTGGIGFCSKCNKPTYYIGDIPPEGFVPGLEPYCTCNNKKQVGGAIGWVCPKCGAGLSPFVTICPCSLSTDITFKSNTP